MVGGYPIVTIVNGATYYVIDPLRGFGLAIERSSRAQGLDAERKTKRPFGLEGERLIADGAEPVRKGKLAGRQSQLYRQTDHLGRREVWITDDALGLPLRLEAFDRSSGATVRTDFVDWARDLPIPDRFFEPAAGVQLERLTYDEYVKRSAEEVLGPAPVMHGDLLHGR